MSASGRAVGRLSRDPKVWNEDSETKCVARFTVACPRRFVREGGPDTDFVDFVAFGKTAGFIAKWFKKGKPIDLDYHIESSKKDDQYLQEAVVDNARFVPGDSSESDGGDKGNGEKGNGNKSGDREEGRGRSGSDREEPRGRGGRDEGRGSRDEGRDEGRGGRDEGRSGGRGGREENREPVGAGARSGGNGGGRGRAPLDDDDVPF